MRRNPNLYQLKMVKIQKNGFKKYKKIVLQKITLKIRIQDPDPKKFENAGSGSVYNVYGSATLELAAQLWIGR